MTQEEIQCYEEWNARLEADLDKERVAFLKFIEEKYGDVSTLIAELDEDALDVVKLKTILSKLMPNPIKVKRIEVREYEITPDIFAEWPPSCNQLLESNSIEDIIKADLEDSWMADDAYEGGLVNRTVTIDISK